VGEAVSGAPGVGIEWERGDGELRMVITVDLAHFAKALDEAKADLARIDAARAARQPCASCGHRRDVHEDVDVTTHADVERVTVGGSCWASVPVAAADAPALTEAEDVDAWAEGVRITDCPCQSYREDDGR